MAIFRKLQLLFALLGLIPLVAISAQYWPAPKSRSIASEIQPAQSQPSPDSAWQRACEGGGGTQQLCYIQQTFSTDEGVLLIAAFGFNEEGVPTGVLTFPLNVLLQSGLALKVDEREQSTFEFSSCNPAGCRAVIPVVHELLASLKAGRTLMVGWRTAGGDQIVVPLTLSGFTAGWLSLGRSSS